MKDFQKISNTKFQGKSILCDLSYSMQTYIKIDIRIYTECPRTNGPDFGRMFLMLKYTDVTQNTYTQS